jgi:DNA helicase-2/ATP-dependent DNA helicase PcrA
LPVPQSASLSFGDTIHKTMERFYKQVQDEKRPTVHDLLSIYHEQWKSVGYGNKSYEMKMKAHGEELLRGFYEKGYVPGSIPKNLEESFKLKITPTLTIGGKVDRVDQLPDGKIEIIDYKTGKAPKTKDVKKDLQLTVYAMAAVDKGVYSYRPEDVIVSFYFFEGQEKVSGTRTGEQLEEAREKIAHTAEAISESTFDPTPGKHCDFCEFRLICEAWQ